MSALRLALAALALILTAAPAAPAVAQWGVAPDGTKGRLHVVAPGDTLWDITETYLGTHWIWPSIWKENEDIQNPHLIYPGDLIWITERGMRKLTPAEAAQIKPFQGEEDAPASADEPPSGPPGFPPERADALDPFASLDGGAADIVRTLRFPGLHRYGYITPRELEGAGAVLGSHEDSYWVSQERRTIASLGEGQSHVGDRYTVFRIRRRVVHPATGETAGYFIQRLGIGEVTEVHPESSYVKILSSYSEIEPGDRLIPYEEEPEEFRIEPTELDLRGIVVAKQPYRQFVGQGDLVVIDRGSFDGLVVGNELEIYRSGKEVLDPVTGSRVLVPDDIMGRMFVLKVGPRTSLVLIREARYQIDVGDHFRTL